MEGLLGAEPDWDCPNGLDDGADEVPKENDGVAEDGELNENEPVVDGLGGSFSAAVFPVPKPKTLLLPEGLLPVWACPNEKGLLLSFFIWPKPLLLGAPPKANDVEGVADSAV